MRPTKHNQYLYQAIQHLVLPAFVIMCVNTLGSAAQITWGSATTVSADANVNTIGTPVYAYAASTTASTINGVTFSAYGGNTASWGGGNVTTSGFTATNTSAFAGSTVTPWNSLSSAYKTVLQGASYGTSAAATVTLNNLTSGRRYSAQVWVNDSRSGASATRTETITGGGGNTITLDYNSSNAQGGVGQYSLGAFTADASSQAFTLKGDASSQMNAIQLRDVTGVWSGQTDGNWANASANFTGGVTWSTVSGQVSSFQFGDTDGYGTAVTNNNITIQGEGVSATSIDFQNSTVNYTLANTDAGLGITGTTSLTKTGSGSVTLTGDHSFSGTTTISAGTLQLGNGGTTGSIGTGAVTNNGTMIVNRSNTYTLASGNLVSGSGAVTLAGAGALASAADGQFNTTGSLNFGASNGATTVSSLNLTNGSSAFGSFNVINNNATANTLTIGDGKTLNVKGAVSIGATTGTTSLTATGSTGSFVVNNGGAATNANFYIGGGGTATGTLDMSGLGTFSANLGTGTFSLGNGSTNTSGAVPYTAKLAAASSITATKVSVGAGFGNSTNASTYTLRLGSAANTINTSDLYIGVYNNQGRGSSGTTLNFNTTTGTLSLRGLTGGSSRANVHIGENQGGSTGTPSGGSFNLGGSTSTELSGGNADLLINALTISRRTAGSNDTSSMTFRSGVMDVNTLVMGNYTGNTGNNATGTLTLNGGTVTFNTEVSLGINTSGTGIGAATLNVAGATVTSTPGLVMGNRSAGTVNSVVNVSAGSLTLGGDISTVGATNTTLTLSGGSLNLGGYKIGTATDSIDTFTINPATAAELKNIGTINGTAGITKTGTGVLTLHANNYSGATVISTGTVQIDGANDIGDSSATNSIQLGAATLRSIANSYSLGTNRSISLTGAGTVQCDADTLTLDGEIKNGSNGLTLLGEGNLVVSGVIGAGATPTGGLTIGSATTGATVTLSGNNAFTGNVSLPATNSQPKATLTLTHSNALGVGPKTVTSIGGSLTKGGEIHLQNNISLASDISFTVSGYTLYNDSGNNVINGNVSMMSGNGNSIITSSSGLLTFTGNFTAITTGRNLVLQGNGNGVISGVISNGQTTDLGVFKNSAGTWTLSGANSYTGVTTVSAGTLVISGSIAASDATVQNGATLGGNGNLGGNLTVQSGAHHALSVAAAPEAQVTRTIAGSLNLNAGNVLDLTAAATPVPGSYVLVTATGGINGDLGTVNQASIPGTVSISGNSIVLNIPSAAGFSTWIGGFTLADSTTTADPDHDGLSNLLEFVLNGNPSQPDPAIQPTVQVTASDFVFTFQRRDDALPPETTQVFEYGSDLSNWTSVSLPATTATQGEISINITDASPADTIAVSVPKSLASGGRLFGRLRVTKP